MTTPTLPTTLTFERTPLTVTAHQGQPHLSASELAKALGYQDSYAVSQIYHRNQDEFSPDMTLTINLMVKGFGGGQSAKPVRLFSPRGCHLVAMLARTARAKAFRHWVLDVLEQLARPTPSAIPPARPAVPPATIELAQSRYIQLLELALAGAQALPPKRPKRPAPRPLTVEEKATILALHQQGMGHIDIARQLGRSRSAVRAWVREQRGPTS
ncbi:helix-turn-helix domain-containing protein [Ferrimonas balearica]|uniref:helix-turn-helix domain-containing protein n=1 Tax=Ferrimonas balearica TaxID=44012 RepID=UPI001C962049|nr:helix-turn-helix domain-containing protein [Ferrimonas balearica]MBY6223586.1 helix-turn-helix domain-containing protein [Ferrimonas balearica]